MVFDQAWFETHQRALLWLLAAPVIGRWFRWVLCIRPHDVGYRGRIVRLLPHAYVVDNGDGTRTADVRTHEKFGKRLYYAFRPLWWALHAWDALVANPLSPALNAGFDTLPQYPDPGTGATTCDGTVWRNGVDESFATIRAGAGVGVTASGTDDQFTYLAASATSNQFAQMWRGFLGFDTSALTASAAVSAATFSIWATAVQNGLGAGGNAHVAGATPAAANTLSTSDFGNVQRTSFGSVSVAGITTGVYTPWTLNAAGIAAISKTSVTSLSLQTEHDINGSFGGTWASGAILQIQAYHADRTGTTNDPKIVVTYTPYTATLQWGVEAELSGAGSGWTDVMDDVSADPIVIEYGVTGNDPTDRVASTGTLSFTLKNGADNSGGVLGYYSPFATVKRSGFNFNIGVRAWLWFGTELRYKFQGVLDVIDPVPGKYGPRVTRVQAVDWMDTAATEDLPALAAVTTKRGDELLTSIMAAVASAPPATSFGTGASTFTYAFDGATGQGLKVREEIIKICASEQGYFTPKGGATAYTFHFEPRGTRTVSSTTALAFNNDMALDGMGTSSSRADIYSSVRVITHPATVAGSATELWTLGGAETPIRAGETITIKGNYQDANGDACGGVNMVAPVATTDYLLNTAADGSGTNLTGSATVVATYSGQGVSVAVTNGSGSNGYITRLVTRGKAVTRTDVTIEQAISGGKGGPLEIDLPYGSSVATARNIATYMATFLASPVARVQSVRFLAQKSSAFMAAAIDVEPGDMVSITEDATGLVGERFNVQRVRYDLMPGGGLLWVTWFVTPAGLDAWWTPSTVSTSGGTVTTGAGYSLHSFTTPGSYTFTVTGGSATVEYFGIGGGAGSGATGSGSLVGGGSAGEPKEGSTTLAAGSYTIVVGAKGTIGNNGSDSTFLGLTAAGGRRGGAEGQAGASGVLGGGAGNAVFVGTNNGDIGATNDWQSYAAGTGTLFNGGADYVNAAGGGAGAGGAGGAANTNTGGDGGPGLTRSITGSSVTYGTGGNGKGLSTDGTRTAGSYGSGGTSGAGVDGAVFIRVSTEA